MADMLDVIIRKHVGPAAKRAGVARKGRYLRIPGEKAHALLHFNNHILYDPRTIFEVNYGVIPLPYWDFSYRDYPVAAVPSAPGMGGLFLHAFLMPPDRWSYAPAGTPVFKRRWAFDDSDDSTEWDDCGAVLAEHLNAEVFPRMRWLLDTDNILTELRQPTFATQLALSSDLHREIVLTVDQADPAHLERLLAEAGPSPAPDFEEWVRARIARRSSDRG